MQFLKKQKQLQDILQAPLAGKFPEWMTVMQGVFTHVAAPLFPGKPFPMAEPEDRVCRNSYPQLQTRKKHFPKETTCPGLHHNIKKSAACCDDAPECFPGMPGIHDG